MKTLFGLGLLALVTLALSQSEILRPQELVARGPASIEKRVSTEEKEQKAKEEKILAEKYALLLQLKGELARLEQENAATAEGLAQFEQYFTSPLQSISPSNEGLAQYLELMERNKGYELKDFDGILSYGEMNSPEEALYYGMPYAPRTYENAEGFYQMNYVPVNSMGYQNSIMEI